MCAHVDYRVLQPADIRYVFRGLTAQDFGGVFRAIYQRILLVPSEPLNGCHPLDNALDINGEVALVQRG